MVSYNIGMAHKDCDCIAKLLLCTDTYFNYAEIHFVGGVMDAFVLPLAAITPFDCHLQYVTSHNVCINWSKQA